MDLKSTLRAITLELRRELEGKYDARGNWQPGDLERRLASIGVRRDRASAPDDALALSGDDREARRVVEAFLQSRAEAGQSREAAVADFVREAAYSWANRLIALRCMETRGLIDDVILQKEAYGGRSLQHQRFARNEPERCSGEDEGLLAMLFEEFTKRAKELPLFFDPKATEVALRPSVAALKRCIALLSGTLAAKGQDAATDEVFGAPDALGWAYQYWNIDEKTRVFEKVRTKKGFKIEGADIVPATCIYTEPYMVKFLVQNSLGAMWMEMNPDSSLFENWEYFVRGAARAGAPKKRVSEITLLDPACGSGHFLIEAFELFFEMYFEEGETTEPAKICASILEHNLHGIDIDERAVQIAALALLMKAKEKAPSFVPRQMNLVATNIRLPEGREHLDAFLRKHPQDTPLKPALLAIFEGLTHADELGSLLQIEEPVERALRSLKALYEASGSPAEQQAFWGELQAPVQGKLPIGTASYEAWKEGVLLRIREHFDAEARDVNLGAAFFGEAASKGLSLLHFLANRYDVVVANPPYMGSKNMATRVKTYVEDHFSLGRRDLYASFISRCVRLSSPEGRVAMVTLSSWLTKDSYCGLRKWLLKNTRVNAVAILARYAFSEADPPGLPVLFVLSNDTPSSESEVIVLEMTGAIDAEAQARRLRALCGQPPPSVARPKQLSLLNLPNVPILAGLSGSLLRCLETAKALSSEATLCEPSTTGDNLRFVRYVWECNIGVRWVRMSKGGGHSRWAGLGYYAMDWEQDGARVKSHPGSYIRNEEWMFKAGITYTAMSRHGISFRQLSNGMTFGKAGPGVFVTREQRLPYLAALNSRLYQYLLRVLNPGASISLGNVGRLPSLSREAVAALGSLAEARLEIAARQVSDDLLEHDFFPMAPPGATSIEGWAMSQLASRIHRDAAAAMLEYEISGLIEREFAIDAEGISRIEERMGVDPCKYPLGDGVTEPQVGWNPPGPFLEVLLQIERGPQQRITDRAVASVKDALRAFGDSDLSGSGCDDGDSDVDEGENQEDDVGPRGTTPGRADSAVIEVARHCGLHPLSASALAARLWCEEPGLCRREVQRFIEDYVSALALRLLGHRWPREIEAGGPVPGWVHGEGVIALTGGASEKRLLARIRDRFEEGFGRDRVSAVEREFEVLVGRPLGTWLSSEFFGRHVSQFRRRPIALQIVSSGVGSSIRRRGRGVGQNAPAFSCLVYYHRLNGDLLPKLRTQYVGPLRSSVQTELEGLEHIKKRSTEQDARRLELEEKAEELRAFDARLAGAITEGFATPALKGVISEELIDKWTSSDGETAAPETLEAFLAQERRYEPDLNDGVRVNIAPLQRAGLLAADVLAAKDVEKAITDRAEWRADERRWCREGKLPRPSWWRESTGDVEPRAAGYGDGKALTKKGKA